MTSPYSSDDTLTERQKAVEASLPAPPGRSTDARPTARYRLHPATRIFVRGPWEWAATIIIAIGIVMLMQPFAIALFSWSFAVILTGLILFLIVSHFPE